MIAQFVSKFSAVISKTCLIFSVSILISLISCDHQDSQRTVSIPPDSNRNAMLKNTEFADLRTKASNLAQNSARSIPAILRGVTLENVEDRDAASPDSKDGRKYKKEITEIANAIKNNSREDQSKWIMTRIVFDLDKDKKKIVPNAANYQRLTTLLHDPSSRSYVMGEILDSKPFVDCLMECFQNRVIDYLSTLGGNVDIWEAGNEINGAWTGEDISLSIAKINFALQKIKEAGGKTAITLYYNKGCAEGREEVFSWLSTYGKNLRKDDIDYVLVSYYEDECKDRRPDAAEWKDFFNTVLLAFKHSDENREKIKVGFGEIGRRDNNAKKDTKLGLIRYYYGIIHTALSQDPDLKDSYIGGYFWWQYKYDMVTGKDKEEFNREFNNILAGW